jgi:hypothetical protein
LGPLGTAATNGLLGQPRVIMMEKLVDWQGKPKYSDKTCPQSSQGRSKVTDNAEVAEATVKKLL